MAEPKAIDEKYEAASQGSLGLIGDGPLELVITGIRQLTPEVRAYELRRPDFQDLPAVAPGSHIEVPVFLTDGRLGTRTYSISSNPSRRDVYEIAVRLDEEGSGGSRSIHESYGLGLRLRASEPMNKFPFHNDGRPVVLIAGGIGITPLKGIAQFLSANGRAFHLHFAARSQLHMAYRSKLSFALDGAVTFYAGDEGQRIDIDAVLSKAPDDAVFYVCGPKGLIDAVRQTAETLGLERERVSYEYFSTARPD
ncbi:MAG: ferredoxin reductase [Rhodospirillales bacterium]